MNLKHLLLALFIVALALNPATGAITSETITWRSSALDRETTYIASLPSPLVPGRRYPVIYLLHGAYDGYTAWTDRTTVTQLLDNRDIILIMPDGDPFGWYLDSPIKASNKYETAICSDLIAEVDARYPTIPQRTSRAICGLSMGGHGALSLALKHPDVFGSASSLSGILDISAHPGKWHLDELLGPQPENIGNWNANSVAHLAATIAETSPTVLQQLPLLFDTGTSDSTGAVGDNRKLDGILNEHRLWHIYREYPGGHTWAYWSAHIPEHLIFHEANFRRHSGN